MLKFPCEWGINRKPKPVAAIKSLLNGKDVLAVLPTGCGKRAVLQFFLRVKEYMLKDSARILSVLFDASDRV